MESADSPWSGGRRVSKLQAAGGWQEGLLFWETVHYSTWERIELSSRQEKEQLKQTMQAGVSSLMPHQGHRLNYT